MVTGKISRDKLRSALASPDATIAEVLAAMDNEVAIIVDSDGRLAGLVTDGDLRRAFLNGAAMHTSVAAIMTRKPMTV
ncbi:MAG: CBS domain-containing protein, partial [Victivallales bacterium]|nr:CBS domain-containing protein [Victivallales bacterium]